LCEAELDEFPHVLLDLAFSNHPCPVTVSNFFTISKPSGDTAMIIAKKVLTSVKAAI
jgi:hypothetical protein